jgi:hypothetical protein
MSTSGNSSRGQWTASVRWEETKLRNKESGWILNGTGAVTGRTRHAGKGRPSLAKRYHDELSSASNSSNSNASWCQSSSGSQSEEELDSFMELHEQEKPEPVNVIIETKALYETIERNCRCIQCGKPVRIEVKTLTLASFISIDCTDRKCGYHYNSPAPGMAKVDDNEDAFQRTTDYAVNILFVLGFLSSGDGGTEAARIIGLLGLPNDTTMETRSFPKIEYRITPKLQQVTEAIMLENLIEEARVSFADMNDFMQWQEALSNRNFVLGRAKYAKLDVSFDMGWQQRSSGNRYASPSGDALLIGCRTKKAIAMVVKSKVCSFCSSWAKKMKELNDPEEDNVELEVPTHMCTKNHDGTSSSMEPQACLEMVTDLFMRRHCIVNMICCDDDASTRSLLRWSNEDYIVG